ncbi:DUF6345 domain-containing protein [Actinophytocola sp.]|uniref:DUF6345 domain-containing protein n=1 Tax=Actinophytocola sp. TaxID=1872138 RepID=UPI002ED1CC41
MARNLGSWWIKDGIDGRRLEAQGFASTLAGLSQFDWTQDHGDSDVLEKDFVTTANWVERTDEVDALMMSSHGSPSGFSVWGSNVTTGDAVDFGKSDLEIFATHACALLEHTSSNPVGRWIPAFERLHYMCGFHNSSYSGGGQDSRGTWFAIYAAWAHYMFLFLWDIPVREAWAEANEIVEGSQVQWAYLRATTDAAPTYNERLREAEPSDPTGVRSFWTARGTC